MIRLLNKEVYKISKVKESLEEKIYEVNVEKEELVKKIDLKNKVIDNGKDSTKELRSAKYKIMELENKLLETQIQLAKLKKAQNPLRKK